MTQNFYNNFHNRICFLTNSYALACKNDRLFGLCFRKNRKNLLVILQMLPMCLSSAINHSISCESKMMIKASDTCQTPISRTNAQKENGKRKIVRKDTALYCSHCSSVQLNRIQSNTRSICLRPIQVLFSSLQPWELIFGLFIAEKISKYQHLLFMLLCCQVLLGTGS